jgi:hypothetical protein
MPVSPSTENYYVGKGKLSFKPTGATTFRDLGNVTELETTPNLTTLEHFSSREGVKKKDKEVVTEKKLTVRLVMDEWTAENLAMALLGDVSVDTNGNSVVDIFSRNAFEGELKYEGTNEIGPQMDIDLFKVAFKPGKSLNPISDEWGNIEIEGEALANDLGKFGTWTVREQTITP